jgi:hypothetical protein
MSFSSGQIWIPIKMRYSGTCLIRNTKGPGKCVWLYRMSEYSGFILVNRNTGAIKFCWISQDVRKLWYRVAQVPLYIHLVDNYTRKSPLISNWSIILENNTFKTYFSWEPYVYLAILDISNAYQKLNFCKGPSKDYSWNYFWKKKNLFVHILYQLWVAILNIW